MAQYKISGKERKAKNKELSLLKSFLKNYWSNHQANKDMFALFGSSSENIITDKKAKEVFDTRFKEMEKLQEDLTELLIKE